MLKKSCLVWVLCCLLFGPSVTATAQDKSVEDRLGDLERKLAKQARLLRTQKRQLEELERSRLSEEVEEEKPEPFPLTLGFCYMESLDKAHRLEFGAIVTTHGTFSESNRDFNDSLEVRYLRPSFSGHLFKYFEFAFDLEFGRTAAADLRNAFINVHVVDEIQLKLGQMLMPFSMERLVPIRYLLHAERPIVGFNMLAPFQIGAMIHGSLFEKRLRYSFGVFNGNGANTGRDDDDAKDFSGRLEVEPLEGLVLAASTIISPRGDGSQIPNDASTVGNQVFRFLDYQEQGLELRGARQRWSVGMTFTKGPAHIMADVITERHEDLRQATGLEKTFSSLIYYIDASYILTGEDKKRGFEPSSPFYSEDGVGMGAWELALRFEDYKVDRDLVRLGFASGADRAIAETFTVNWYPVKGMLFGVSYTHTDFNEGVRDSKGRQQHSDDTVIMRAVLYF